MKNQILSRRTAAAFLFALGMQACLCSAGQSNAVAIVNGTEILASDVERQVARVVQGREVDPAALTTLQAQAVEQLVKRQLILEYLDAQKVGATAAELDLAQTRIAGELHRQSKTLKTYLEETGQTREQFRRTLAWQIGWTRYLEQYATEANLKKFYQRNPRQFDGTKLKVAHIVRVVARRDTTGRIAAQEMLVKLRTRIEAGELDFEKAAAEYSQSPTAANGGDIGWIDRRQPMPESFSKAAFQLKPGEVGLPVETAVGVHLIRCVDVQPGKLSWAEMKGRVRLAATQFLFNWVAGQHEGTAKIEYTGKLPYFHPESRKIVIAE